MAESKTPSDNVRAMIAQNIEQARGAMTNYFSVSRKEYVSISVGRGGSS
jgi:hypothetical protein